MIAFTEEQLAVVEDRAGPLLVAAGAGSGKTRVMVERIVRAVIEDGVEVGRILAITFTEKAAGELADRVRDRFLELGRYDAARDAERAWISTIHGFCARLLRAHALAAGVDPEFRVLDETDSAWLRRAAFEDALEELLDAADGEEALGDLAPFSVADLRDLVVAAYERLRVQGAAEPTLPMPEVAGADAACARLVAAAPVLAAELGRAATNKTVEKALTAVGRCLELAGRMPDRDELEAIAVAGGNAKALQTDAAKEYTAAHGDLRQAATDAEALPALRRIDALLRAFARRYAELKSARSGLDFEDLELRADALLAADDSLRERYAERFVHVMVDEFQDTNPVQLRIIERVASDNLFTVGDEFQSIYSFRHADVALFRARRAALAPAGRVRELATSFRAHRELLEALRVAFAGGLFGADYVPLLPANSEAEAEAEAEAEPGGQLSLDGLGESPRSPVAGEPRVEILVTEKDRDAGWDAIDLGDTLPRDTVWRLAEARLLAQRIRELVDAGRSPGDIAVLARATAGMAVIERALADAGVPTYLIGGRGFWSQRQVADLTAYLAALANPRDDLRLYEALASPLGGATSDTLAILADAARSRSAWDRLAAEEPIPGLDGGEAERLRAFATLLQAHRELTARLPLDGLIERVIADTRYDLAVLQLPGGERRLANVRKLLRLAREFEAQEGRDLRGLVDLVEALAGEELGPDREGEAPVESEDLAAVRIMTIHRAKGLEFPVVCVADMGREPFTGGRDLLRLDRDGRIGLKLPSDANGGRPAFDWERIKEDQQAEADAEERRLFYVAMTRAQEHLVLSGALPRRRPATREPLAWIAHALVGDALERLTPEEPVDIAGPARVRCVLNAPPTVGVVLTATAPEAPDPFAEPERTAVAPAPLALEAPPPALPVPHLSYSTLESYNRCGYRFYLERVLGLPRVPAPPPPADAGQRLPALVRGSLAHILLEELDLAAPIDPTDEALDLLAADKDAVLTPEDRDDLRDLVARFVASRLGARLAAADEVRREAGFSFVAGSGEDAVLVNGYVDALARDAEGTLIVDYKTDRLGDETPEEVVARDYRIQQVIYALAALRAGAPAVEVAHCFLERADEPVWARYGSVDVPALEAELAASAAGIRDGVFPVSGRPHYELCATCPGRGTLCSWPEEATVRASPEAIASG